LFLPDKFSEKLQQQIGNIRDLSESLLLSCSLFGKVCTICGTIIITLIITPPKNKSPENFRNQGFD
jgi:hypothetical protein